VKSTDFGTLFRRRLVVAACSMQATWLPFTAEQLSAGANIVAGVVTSSSSSADRPINRGVTVIPHRLPAAMHAFKHTHTHTVRIQVHKTRLNSTRWVVALTPSNVFSRTLFPRYRAVDLNKQTSNYENYKKYSELSHIRKTARRSGYLIKARTERRNWTELTRLSCWRTDQWERRTS